MKMRALLYHKDSSTGINHLKVKIETLFSPDKIEIHHGFQSLSSRLRQPKNDLDILVLVVKDMLDLVDLLTLRDVLGDYRIILVLPDHHKKTLMMSHKFFPRFITYKDSGSTDILLVLKNMIEFNNKKRSEE